MTQMAQRRLFMLALGVALNGNCELLPAQTTSVTLRRVGVLAPSTLAKEEVTLQPFFDQMRLLGWVEGQNIAYDRVFADDQHQMLPRLADELVARKPEVLYAPPTPAAMAAKQATRTIPIVFAVVLDPVGVGLVTSLPHPGGNATGMASSATELEVKRIQLLRGILPGARRYGLLSDSGDPSRKLARQSLESLAASLGLTFVFAQAANPVEFDAAVARLIADRVEVISVSGTPPIVGNLRGKLIASANQSRIPVIAGDAAFAATGALFTYGSSTADLLRRSALVVDKILNGAKPGDIPVEQPTLFELVVNLKTAKALGITVPQSFLLRADRVIQ